MQKFINIQKTPQKIEVVRASGHTIAYYRKASKIIKIMESKIHYCDQSFISENTLFTSFLAAVIAQWNNIN